MNAFVCPREVLPVYSITDSTAVSGVGKVELPNHPALVERHGHALDGFDADGGGAVAGEEHAGALDHGGRSNVLRTGPFLRLGTGNTQIGNRLPRAFEPVAVFIRAIALRHPLGQRREELSLARHVELGAVAESPTTRRLVAEEHATGIHMIEQRHVAWVTDFHE